MKKYVVVLIDRRGQKFFFEGIKHAGAAGGYLKSAAFSPKIRKTSYFYSITQANKAWHDYLTWNKQGSYRWKYISIDEVV